MEDEIIYFAYGSNMNTKKFKEIIKLAEKMGIGKIEDRRLVFNKKSNDGSTKANLKYQKGNSVWGVIYRIDIDDLKKLDRKEGGYSRKEFDIVTGRGVKISAYIYISDKIIENKLPYNWYVNHIIKGAKENNLPADYIKSLEGVKYK